MGFEMRGIDHQSVRCSGLSGQIGQTVGHDASHQIDEEIEGGAMAGVLDLAKVLQFVKDCLDQETAVQKAFSNSVRYTGFMFFLRGVMS